MKHKDLISGNYYVGEFDERKRVILFYPGTLVSGVDYIDSNNVYARGSCCNSSSVVFRNATEEEKFWLKSCMKAGKTVTFVEALEEEEYQIY